MCELILTTGFRTDSDLLGVERLAVFMPTDEWLDGTQGGLECLPPLEPGSCLGSMFSSSKQHAKAKVSFQPVPIALCAVRFGQLPGQLLRPFSIGYVKGWRRSVAALIVMQGFKELDIDLDTLPRPIRVS